MAHITGHVRIAAPLEQVFDTFSDSRNEPSFNPAMTDVQLLTALPIGLGTRFLAHMGKANTEMVVDLTEFERLHRLSSVTTSSAMATSGELTLTTEGDVSVMGWRRGRWPRSYASPAMSPLMTPRRTGLPGRWLNASGSAKTPSPGSGPITTSNPGGWTTSSCPTTV